MRLQQHRYDCACATRCVRVNPLGQSHTRIGQSTPNEHTSSPTKKHACKRMTLAVLQHQCFRAGLHLNQKRPRTPQQKATAAQKHKKLSKHARLVANAAAAWGPAPTAGGGANSPPKQIDCHRRSTTHTCAPHQSRRYWHGACVCVPRGRPANVRNHTCQPQHAKAP